MAHPSLFRFGLAGVSSFFTTEFCVSLFIITTLGSACVPNTLVVASKLLSRFHLICCASRPPYRNEIQRQSSNEDGSELQQEIGKLKSECTSSYVEGVNWTSNRRQCELHEYLF